MQPQQAQQFRCFPLDFRFRQLPQPANQLQVFEPGEVGIHVSLFRHIAEAPPEADQVRPNVDTIPQDVPGRGIQQACKHFDRSRFSRAVGPEIARDQAGPHVETDVIDYGAIAVFLGQAANFQSPHAPSLAPYVDSYNMRVYNSDVSDVKLSHTSSMILQTIGTGHAYGFDIMEATG